MLWTSSKVFLQAHRRFISRTTIFVRPPTARIGTSLLFRTMSSSSTSTGLPFTRLRSEAELAVKAVLQACILYVHLLMLLGIVVETGQDESCSEVF